MRIAGRCGDIAKRHIQGILEVWQRQPANKAAEAFTSERNTSAVYENPKSASSTLHMMDMQASLKMS